MTRSRAAKAANSKTSARKSRAKRKSAGNPGATVAAAIAARAQSDPDAPALLAPRRDPLTYGALAALMDEAGDALRALGVKRSDRVAIVLEDACNAAGAFLCVAGAAVACPFNPQYLESEFESYFAALKPRALIAGEGGDAARAAADKTKIPVLTLRPAQAAGAFAFEAPAAKAKRAAKADAKPDDTALLLFTSGTTAKPKLVPLTQGNLAASAQAVADTLRLGPEDRGLAVMPLFHIHGLVAGLLAPLFAGGSVALPPGFHPIDVFDWIQSFAPTWFTAVPSMHQSLLARAGDHKEILARAKLRFLRSSSAPLAPDVLNQLEKAFGAPVIESYGMTEAAHQVTSNPLPPAHRKPGTVGLPAGPEVAILGADGTFLGAGEEGEVVIRGPNVTKGYLDAAAANRDAFFKGWFKTGDLGVFDGEGYLRLVARIKEIINRGGEKIAPREVEDVLMAHADVAEAAVFPVPDDALGEEVAAAVVLTPNARTDVSELKSFAAGRLAHFKLPRRIAVVAEIPKSPTGKIKRDALPALLESAEEPAASAESKTAPRPDLEAALAGLWREVLRVKEVGRDTSFLSLGGDSILAAQLVARIRGKLGLDVTMADIWDTPTVADQAARLAEIKRRRGALAIKIPRRSRDVISFSQEWWLHLESLFGNRAASNRMSSVLLEGPLDAAALAQALGSVVERHEPLRTSFKGGPGDYRPVLHPAGQVAITHGEVSGASIEEKLETAHQVARDTARKALPHDSYPLWRAGLLRIAANMHVLVFVVDHALFDGWSMSVFVRDLARFYEGIVDRAPVRLAPLATHYGDVAAWQRGRLTGETLARLEKFWSRKMAGNAEPPRLPFAKTRPGKPDLRGGTISARIAAAVGERLRGLARAEGATLYMAALAVFHALIARETGETDVLTGALTAGRENVATEDLVGLFFNTLPLRGDLSGDPTPRELIARSRALVIDAFAHQDMPVQRIVALAGAETEAGKKAVPLVPVLFQMRNFPEAKAKGGGVTFSEFKTPGEWATFDLTFDLRDTDEGIACDLAYRLEAYESKDIKRMLSDFARLAAAFAAEPDTPLSKLDIGGGERKR